MRYFFGGLAALFLFAACGQMGPLVLPPAKPNPPPAPAPVAVQPLQPEQPLQGLPASGVQTESVESKKDKP
jgi:predicted small lipoprotein YifL